MKAAKNNARRILKAAIAGSGKTQRAIARRTGIPEVRLSKIVTLREQANEVERGRLARVLGLSESELFPDVEQVAL